MLTDRLIPRPVKKKNFTGFYFCGNGERLLVHHSIRQDGKLHLVSSTGCSLCFEILSTPDAGIAQLV